ncbi:hypothetical protein GOBAR_DD15111 [Gossypium barbadense]|nr:hypothetical protein GOBAR_DD15111 [Gossypium barbadense]
MLNKWGGAEYPPRWYEGFRECIASCDLFEIPLTGVGYTCERVRGSDCLVLGRLDRAFACPSWFHLFPYRKLLNLVLLPVYRVQRFRFENTWLLETGFDDVITRTWANCSTRAISGLKKRMGSVRWQQPSDQRLLDLRSELNSLLVQESVYYVHPYITVRGSKTLKSQM